MRLSIRQYAQALLDLEREQEGMEVVRKGERFVAWLSRRGEVRKLGKIVREDESLIREQSGRAAVCITTAYQADSALRAVLEKEAARVFAGKKVEVSFATDMRGIGGSKMQSEEVLYDATLRTRFERLGKSLRG